MRGLGALDPTALADPTSVDVSKLPPWIYPPAEFEAFDFSTYLAIPAIAAGGAVISFVVPSGRNGVIRKVANVFVGGGFQEGSGSIFWQIRADQVPAPNYENVVASLGSVANPTDFAGIRVYEGQVIDLFVQNVSIVVAGQLIGGRLQGWFYPMQIEEGDIWL
jgi:hypothetical protein